MTKAQFQAVYDVLKAEIETLREEVALLRAQQAAHVCPSFVPPYGTVVYPGTAQPPGTLWPWTNVCAGAAGYNPVQTVLTPPGGEVLHFQQNTAVAGAAGCNPPLIFNTVAGA